MWKEAIVPSYEDLFFNLPGETVDNQEKLQLKLVGFRVEIRSLGLPSRSRNATHFIRT